MIYRISLFSLTIAPYMLFFGANLKTFPWLKIVELFICSYIDPKVYKTPIKPSVAIFLIFANILASFLLLMQNIGGMAHILKIIYQNASSIKKSTCFYLLKGYIIFKNIYLLYRYQLILITFKYLKMVFIDLKIYFIKPLNDLKILILDTVIHSQFKKI